MRLPLTDPQDQSSIDYKAFEEMIDEFLSQGFTYFDTAYMYHAHQSEIAVRECLVKRHQRDSFLVASKLPTMVLKNEGDQERIFDEQLEKVGVDYFDYYLLHNLSIDHYAAIQKFDSFSFLKQKQKEGKIRRLGFSFHDNAELLDTILTAHPEVEFVQLQINYLDWDNAGIQSGACYEVARKHNIPIIVMEPVKGGMLADVPPQISAMFSSLAPGASAASWAVRYAAGLEGVFMVLSGMSDLAQLKDNTGYMNDFHPLDEKEQEIVAEAVSVMKENIEVACTACRYCVDGCPENIAIPEYFGLLNAQKLSNGKGFTLQNIYYNNLVSSGRGKASACIECGECETSCPQHLPIISHLKDVVTILELPQRN